MLKTFDSGLLHLDVDTNNGVLHIRYAAVGYYKPDQARALADFLCEHYRGKSPEVDVSTFAVEVPEPKKAK